MKISTFLATGLGVFLLAGAANAATVTYTAKLTGPQASNASTATATGTFDFDDVSKKLTGSIVYQDFTLVPTNAHLHTGGCTEAGSSFATIGPETTPTPVAASGSFNLPPSTSVNAIVLDTDLEAALTAGKLFATVSTEAFAFPPNYEIRGALIADGVANNLCGTEGVDAGTDSSTDAGTISTGVDAGTTPTTEPTTTDSSSGCNTTGGSSSPGSNAALALGLGLALYGISRKRKQA